MYLALQQVCDVYVNVLEEVPFLLAQLFDNHLLLCSFLSTHLLHSNIHVGESY